MWVVVVCRVVGTVGGLFCFVFVFFFFGFYKKIAGFFFNVILMYCIYYFNVLNGNIEHVM